MKNKIAIAAAGALAFGVLCVGGIALASSYFSGTVQTASATSTPAYMTPGTATSTLVYNTYTNTNVATATPTTSNVSKAEKLALVGQFQGSSTAAVLHIAYEYSQDGLDWYQNYLPIGGYSTTTQALTFTAADSIAIPFASSTYNGISTKIDNDRFIVEVPIPTKDVRVVVTLTGANGAFWGQLVPVKQLP